MLFLTSVYSKNKVDQYQDGVCYLTSHRLIYVDNTNPLEYSIEMSLALIKEIESYVSYISFFLNQILTYIYLAGWIFKIIT